MAPMAHHDFFAFAGYFVPKSAFDSANLEHLTDAWVAAIGNPQAQEAACAAYVRGLVDPTVGGNETVDRYQLALLPAYIAKMRSYGKSVIMYEGGWDHDIKPVSAEGQVTPTLPYASGQIDGRSNTITGVRAAYAAALRPGYFVVGYGILPDATVLSASGGTIALSKNTTARLGVAQFVAFSPEQMFLFAVKRSRAWAAALLTFFNQFGSGSGMPAEYVQSGLRWGHSFPSSYGLANVEWADVDHCWQQQAIRNRGLI
jgi:hypothetical protein